MKFVEAYPNSIDKNMFVSFPVSIYAYELSQCEDMSLLSEDWARFQSILLSFEK